MQRVLFNSTVFGPIHSRRLGTSLGVNLMPNDGKVCSFDCLYCEAGFNAQGAGTTGLPTRADVARLLGDKLARMKADGAPLDVITFSGNGEPTMHPDFGGIVDDTIDLRNRYYPEAKVSVLSNATRLDRSDVVEALKRIDNNILKLDSALDSTVRVLDRPVSAAYRVADVVELMKQFGGECIVQTMILRGEHDGITVDNTTDREIDALIAAVKEIAPKEIMLYSIDRKTPAEHLVKVEKDELEHIAGRFRAAGINVACF